MAPATANPHLLFFLLLAITLHPSNSDLRAKEALLVCSNQTAPLSNRQQFVSNFIAALDSLTPQIALNRYGAAHNGSANLSVYAFSQCFSDLSSTDCSLFSDRQPISKPRSRTAPPADIKTQIQKCLPYQKLTRGGRLFSASAGNGGIFGTLAGFFVRSLNLEMARKKTMNSNLYCSSCFCLFFKTLLI